MDGQQPTDTPPAEPQQFKPGDTITPGEVPPAADSATTSKSLPVTPETPATSAPPVAPVISEPAAQPTPASTEPDTAAAQPIRNSDDPLPQPQDNQGVISWTASEFIAHDKSASWYGALALGALLLAALVFLLTKDKISTGVVIVAGLALGIYGARKPQQLRYELNEQGVGIGQKFYAYNQLRSFAIIDEGAFSSISFTPLNRFGQLITIYFDPADEERIVDLLANRLPLEERGHDAVDKFMKRIRF